MILMKVFAPIVTQPRHLIRPARTLRSCNLLWALLLSITVCAHGEIAPNPAKQSQTVTEWSLSPDYTASELADIEDLTELLPENLFAIEIILFKRLNTFDQLLATKEPPNQGADTTLDGVLDSREPLLSRAERALPKGLYQLSPALMRPEQRELGKKELGNKELSETELRETELRETEPSATEPRATTQEQGAEQLGYGPGGFEQEDTAATDPTVLTLKPAGLPLCYETPHKILKSKDMLAQQNDDGKQRLTDNDPTDSDLTEAAGYSVRAAEQMSGADWRDLTAAGAADGLTNPAAPESIARGTIDLNPYRNNAESSGVEVTSEFSTAANESMSLAAETVEPVPFESVTFESINFGLVPRNQSEIVVTPYLTLIQDLSLFAENQAINEYRRKPTENLTLTQIARRIERSGDFAVLEHVAWQQKVPARDAPQPLYVNVNNGELQGHLAVTLGRYLHTAATLWLQPNSLSTGLLGGSEAETAARPYAQMQQSRRMRSGEMHYFDHPLFGMIVRIDKVVHPEALEAQFSQFKSAQEPTDG